MIYKKLVAILCCLSLLVLPLAACGENANTSSGGVTGGGEFNGGNSGGDTSDGYDTIPDESADEIVVDTTQHNFTLASAENGVYTFTCSHCDKTAVTTV